MRRKLFFFIDRMKISRSERIAVSLLALILLILGSLNLVLEKSPFWSPEEYIALEEVFQSKIRQQQAERDAILARYSTGIDENMSEIIAENSVDVGTFPRADVDTSVRDRKDPGEEVTEFVHSDSSADEPSGPPGVLVNINEATALELQRLPGIGPAYSERIVNWREVNGLFTSAEQLLEISGIGPVRLRNLRPLIEL